MPQVMINGISVEFPFEPYPLQMAYMNQVLSCLKNKKNGLLESPTGTGKTLSLLCSSLAWLNNQKLTPEFVMDEEDNKLEDEVKIHSRFQGKIKGFNAEESPEKISMKSSTGPKIFFSSRTHVQLSQSINEMKKSAYNANTAVVLGSRDQLCLHPDVQKLESNSAKNQVCKSKTSHGCDCIYYAKYEEKVATIGDYSKRKIMDIEDLVQLGKKHNCCPYFASRALQERSDVIFLPYNYLLDPKIRKYQGVELKNSVAIFDEGHNLEKMCEDAISTELSSTHIAFACKELDIMLTEVNKFQNGEMMDIKVREQLAEIAPEDLAGLKQLLLDLEAEVDMALKRAKIEKFKTEFVHDDFWVFNVLARIGLDVSNYKKYLNLLDKIMSILASTFTAQKPIDSLGVTAFENMRLFFGLLFSEQNDYNYESFKSEFTRKFKICTIVEEEKVQTKNKSDSGWFVAKEPPKVVSVKSWSLHIWCLTPSVGMASLMKTKLRNIIITSGTLAPLDSFEAEFGMQFPIRLENQHIINKTQMAIYPISRSFREVVLNSKYENKNNLDYYRGLGDTVVDICHHVPQGVLLFFSSYSMMYKCINLWKEREFDWRIWSKLGSLKQIFEEPKSRGLFGDSIESFKQKVDQPRSGGAIFMGVCRGKLSEGLDLSNQYCRAVIMIGMPFPALMDPRVVQKKLYIDKMKFPSLNSSQWYMLQMKRALNQAVGRAIRNKDDYGCVYLLDYRFEHSINDLSKWCRSFVIKKNYRDIIKDTIEFFDRNKKFALELKEKKARHLDQVKQEEKCSLLDMYERPEKRRLLDDQPEDENEFSFSEYTKKPRASTKRKTATSKPMFQDSIMQSFIQRGQAQKAETSNEKKNSLFDTLYGSSKGFTRNKEKSRDNGPKKVLKPKKSLFDVPTVDLD